MGLMGRDGGEIPAGRKRSACGEIEGDWEVAGFEVGPRAVWVKAGECNIDRWAALCYRSPIKSSRRAEILFSGSAVPPVRSGNYWFHEMR